MFSLRRSLGPHTWNTMPLNLISSARVHALQIFWHTVILISAVGKVKRERLIPVALKKVVSWAMKALHLSRLRFHLYHMEKVLLGF